MKKRLLTLSPLLFSILPSQNSLHAMENTTFEKSVYLSHPAKANSVLDELQQHPRFINAYTDTADQKSHLSTQDMEEFKNLMIDLRETFGLNPDRIQELKDMGISLDKSLAKTDNQEQLNLEISRLMNGSIPSDDELKTITTETTQKTGFNWTLRFKQYTYSKADLALYALQSDMFEPDNSDHLALLDHGILECITTKSNDKLLEILKTTKTKHAGKVLLSDETSQTIRQTLSSVEENGKATFINNFSQFNAEKQAICIALIHNLQKKYTATIEELLAIQNSLNSEYSTQKQAFRDHTNADKKIMSTLKALSTPHTITQKKNSSWEDETTNIQNTSKNISLTLDALQNSQPTIKDLSHFLLLENK